MIATKMRQNKVTQDKIDAFNKKIHSEGGRLPLVDLRKLDSVYKKEYAKMIIEEDDAIRQQLIQTNRRATITEDNIHALQNGILETNQTWDAAQEELAQALYNQGVKWRVIEQHLESPEFKEDRFDIQEMVE